MKYLAGLFLSIILLNNAQATTLCDASCELIITFPDGGSITADEPVLFTFGSDGLLNLGAAGTINMNPQPASTDYASGGTLALVRGEYISFDSGGVIRLGAGGNVEYSDMVIDSTGGSARVKAVGNTESIFIDNLTIRGALSITLEGRQVSLTGALNIASDSELVIIAGTGGLTPSVCNIQNASSGVTLRAGTIDTTSSCNAISDSLNLSAGTVTMVAIDPNATLVSSSGKILTPSPIVISPGGITLQPQNLTQALLATFADGTTLVTDDGNTCAITAGECVSTAGDTYVVVDGKLLLPAAKENPAPAAASGSGAGSFGLPASFVLFVLMWFRFMTAAGVKFRQN